MQFLISMFPTPTDRERKTERRGEERRGQRELISAWPELSLPAPAQDSVNYLVTSLILSLIVTRSNTQYSV